MKMETAFEEVTQVEEQMKKGKVVQLATTYEVRGQEISLDLNTIALYLTRGNQAITKQEALLFMNVCKYNMLNPFLNEAYLIKIGDYPAQIVIGKDAFMKRAESSEDYKGFRAGIILGRKKKGSDEIEIVEEEGTFYLPGDTLYGGWCEVYRENRPYPIKQKVTLGEYSKAGGSHKNTWDDKPGTMIRKVAIVQAMREAFPSQLSNLYIEDELPAQEPSNKDEIKVEANSQELIVKNKEVISDEVQEIKSAQNKEQSNKNKEQSNKNDEQSDAKPEQNKEKHEVEKTETKKYNDKVKAPF